MALSCREEIAEADTIEKENVGRVLDRPRVDQLQKDCDIAYRRSTTRSEGAAQPSVVGWAAARSDFLIFPGPSGTLRAPGAPGGSLSAPLRLL